MKKIEYGAEGEILLLNDFICTILYAYNNQIDRNENSKLTIFNNWRGRYD